MAKAKKKTEIVKSEEEVIPKILIGVPILAWTHEFATSFLKFWTDLMTYQRKGKKFHVGYEFAYRRPVHMAEEELVFAAQQSGCTHILLMDDDIYDVTADDFVKLLDADKDVISGIMFASGFPYAMCAFRRYDTSVKVADMPVQEGTARLYEVPADQREGVQEVDLIPFCFTLIKLSVFDKLKKPYFTCDTQAPTDSWFMDSVMDKGIKPHAHFDVWLNHRGVTRYNQPHWWNMHLANNQAKGDKRGIVELTPEEMKRHEIYMAMKLKQAEENAKKERASRLGFFEKSEGVAIATPVSKVGG